MWQPPDMLSMHLRLWYRVVETQLWSWEKPVIFLWLRNLQLGINVYPSNQIGGLQKIIGRSRTPVPTSVPSRNGSRRGFELFGNAAEIWSTSWPCRLCFVPPSGALLLGTDKSHVNRWIKAVWGEKKTCIITMIGTTTTTTTTTANDHSRPPSPPRRRIRRTTTTITTSFLISLFLNIFLPQVCGANFCCSPKPRFSNVERQRRPLLLGCPRRSNLVAVDCLFFWDPKWAFLQMAEKKSLLKNQV